MDELMLNVLGIPPDADPVDRKVHEMVLATKIILPWQTVNINPAHSLSRDTEKP